MSWRASKIGRRAYREPASPVGVRLSRGGSVSAPRAQEAASEGEHSFRLIDFIDRLKDDKELFLHCVRTVQDLMDPDPEFLTLDDKIATAMHFFENRDARCVAILDEVDEVDDDSEAAEVRLELIGVVSRRDVSRILSYGHGTLVEDDRDETNLRERLVAIVTRNPITLTPTTALVDAIQIMVDEQIDFVPVVLEGKELVGTLSVSDIIKCFVQLDFLRRMRARSSGQTRLVDVVRGRMKPTELLVEQFLGTVVDIMQPQSEVAIHTGDSIMAAVKMMEQRHLRHLLVVNGKGKLKGLISDRDIMSYLPVQPPYLFGAAKFHGNLFRIDLRDPQTSAALAAQVRLAMTVVPTTVEPTASIAEVAELLASQSVDALPVVSDEGRGDALGIVTDGDLLRALFGLIRLAGGDLRPGMRNR